MVTGGVAGCAALQSTEEQQATWAAIQVCDRFPGVTPDRVDAHGRYSFHYTHGASVADFQACVARERASASTARYAAARAVERVYEAYFVAATPPNGGVLLDPPAKHAIFDRDAPVLFYYNVWNSGRPVRATFRWYAPDHSLVAQEDEVLEGSVHTDRTWYVQRMPRARGQEIGDWALEFTIDGELIGRYSFSIVP